MILQKLILLWCLSKVQLVMDTAEPIEKRVEMGMYQLVCN